MATSMREISKTEREMGKERESTLTGLNTKESTWMTNLMEEVRLVKRLPSGLHKLGIIFLIGLYIWKDGERYEGEWKDGKFHGKGIKTLPDGTVFDGEWFEGRPFGSGMCKYPDGAKYTGNWLNG